MKLCYRGVSYEHNSSQVEIIRGEVVGKYRGSNWYSKLLLLQKNSISISKNLKYRGISYCCGIAQKCDLLKTKLTLSR